MDWEKLKTFYYVAKAGSFSKAAETLFISQSALSRQISLLEDAFKVKLFVRHGRGIHLTEEGAMVYESVAKMFSEIESTHTKITESIHEPVGEIKIATTNALASPWLPQYIPGYMERYPKVKLSIIGEDKELDLHTREADVAIRPFAEHGTDLVQDPLISFHLGLYASKKYLKNYGTPKSPSDLDNHRLLIYGDYRNFPYDKFNWILKVDRKEGVRDYALCMNSSQGLALLAEAHMGIAPLSSEYTLKNKNLVRVLPELNGPVVKIYYVYPKNLKNIKRIQSLGDYLKEAIRKEE